MDIEIGTATIETPTTKLINDPDVTSRKIRKTLGAVTVQLLVTFFIALWCRNSKTFTEMTLDEAINTINLFGYLGIAFMLVCFIFSKKCCCPSFIGQLVCFIGFTICMAITLAIGIIGFDAQILLQACFITITITTFVTVYVIVTGSDFSSLNGPLCVILLCFIFVGSVVFLIFPPSNLIQIVYAVVGIILFVAYLLVDVSLMIHKYDEDEWMIAAIGIYLDIINLFIYILMLLEKLSKFCPKKN
jgi:protein lifeguard